MKNGAFVMLTKTQRRCDDGDDAGQRGFDHFFDRKGKGFFGKGGGMTDKTGDGCCRFKAELAEDRVSAALVRTQGCVKRPLAVPTAGMQRPAQQRRQGRDLEIADQPQPVGIAATGQLDGGDDLPFRFIDETLDLFRLPPRAQIQGGGILIVVARASFRLLNQGRGIATMEPLQGKAIGLALAAHMGPGLFFVSPSFPFDPRMAKEGFLNVGDKTDGRDNRLGFVLAFQAEIKALNAVFAGLQADVLQQSLPDITGLGMGMIGRGNTGQVGFGPGKTFDGLDKAVNRVGVIGHMEVCGRARPMPGQRRAHCCPYHGQRIGKAMFQTQRGAAPGQALQTQAVTQAKGLDQGQKEKETAIAP